MLKLIFMNIKQVVDGYARENFQKLSDFINNETILKYRFRHIEFEFTSNETNKKFAHNLGFTPKDLIQTFKSGTGAVTFNYGLFDETNLDITISGTDPNDPLIVRAMVGRYSE